MATATADDSVPSTPEVAHVDAWGLLWKHVARRFVDGADPEPAAPHRFAKLMGATFTLGASALLLTGFPLPGFAVAAMVAALAGIAAGADRCVGCRLYRQVSFFRRLGVV